MSADHWTIYVCPVCGDWMGGRNLELPVICGGPRGPHDQVDAESIEVVRKPAFDDESER